MTNLKRNQGDIGLFAGAVAVLFMVTSSIWAEEEKKPMPALSAAVLKFQDRTDGKAQTDGKSVADKVAELLSVELMAAPEFVMVEREELDRILKEHELNLSGVVSTDEAVKAGRLTGARLIIMGSIIDTGTDRNLVAKIVSTETSRVLGTIAKGKVSDNLGELTTKLSEQVATVVREKGASLLPPVESREDKLAKLKKSLDGKPALTVMVKVTERHVSAATIDPAAETELTLWCRELGWKTIDPTTGDPADADFLITGEGLSELAGRRGGLVSVRSRLEVKVVHRRTGEVVAIDRHMARVADTTEMIAGKEALQQAAAIIAERIIPKIAAPAEKKKG